MEDIKGLDTQLPGTAASATQLAEGALLKTEIDTGTRKKKKKRRYYNPFVAGSYVEREVEEED